MRRNQRASRHQGSFFYGNLWKFLYDSLSEDTVHFGKRINDLTHGAETQQQTGASSSSQAIVVEGVSYDFVVVIDSCTYRATARCRRHFHPVGGRCTCQFAQAAAIGSQHWTNETNKTKKKMPLRPRKLHEGQPTVPSLAFDDDDDDDEELNPPGQPLHTQQDPEVYWSCAESAASPQPQSPPPSSNNNSPENEDDEKEEAIQFKNADDAARVARSTCNVRRCKQHDDEEAYQSALEECLQQAALRQIPMCVTNPDE